MKNILILLLLPILTIGQIINTFPWTNDFENGVALEQDTADFADWYLMQGPTGSVNTGPNGDHTTGSGMYFYVESSNPNFPNKVFIVYTPRFDVSQTPGKVLSFWYHMYGAAMGDLEVGVLDSTGYTALDTISGNQGNQWQLAYYPITSTNPFKIKFKATTGSSYTSDIAIDDVMISDPFTVIYGCTDSVSSNYSPTATHDDGTCIYYYGCIDSSATNYNPWANVDNGSCIQDVICDSTESLIDVAIKLDNWPGETSWEVTANDSVIYTVPSGTYDYTQTGQIVHTQLCIPVGDTIVFTLNDTYGDGIGGGSVVGSCLVTNVDCEDTLFVLNPPNFGSTISSSTYVSDTCSNDVTIYGCTTPSYLEYDSLATVDDGSCMTLATYGCTDSTAFNYDPTADRMLLTSPCDYNLILYDDGGDSWGACWLGVEQGDSLWQFKINQNGVYSDTIQLNLNSDDEVYFYYFEIPTPQQNTQQLDIQTIQNSFKLENSYGTIIHQGNNPWPGPNENKLRNYKSALDIYEAQPYCGNECIAVVTGCMDTIAYNYNSLANTNDLCYYSPGCTNVGYLEYYTQGYVADVDDGSCSTLAVFGCTDATAFNYDPTANVDNGGCVPVILGCMDAFAFNYNPQANTPSACIPYIYGCTSPIALNYNPLANTDDGSCIGVVYGCTDTIAFNWNPNANVDDGSCVPVIYGCINPVMFNYCDTCNTNDGSCIEILYGCTDSTMFNFNPLANVDNNTCTPFIYGCTDPSMLNYNIEANTEDFSCIPFIYGCTDSTALNYDPLANTENGSCIEAIAGCRDPDAFNYNPLANIIAHDSLGCLYAATWCINGSGNPFFLNDECYAWVIEVDEYCCENEWDDICQLTYDHCSNGWTGSLPPARKFEGDIQMYPNPTKGVVNFSTFLDVSVYDFTGKKVLEDKNVNNINLSSYSSGFYNIIVIFEGKSIQYKITKE
jgi:hypothetical protein